MKVKAECSREHEQYIECTDKYPMFYRQGKCIQEFKTFAACSDRVTKSEST